MTDEILELFKSKDPLCADGRAFLVDRGLHIPAALKCGVASKNGWIYFAYEQNGEIVRWKGRSMINKKEQRTSFMSDADKINFKMPFFSHSKGAPSSQLVITEGEFDCIALTQLASNKGHSPRFVSLPHGASSVESTFRNNYAYLQSFDEIFIAFDMDEAGEAAAKKAMSMLPPAKFRRIIFPRKDANEWVLKDQPEWEDFLRLMNTSKRIESPCIVPMVDLPMEYYAEIDLGVSSGFKKLDDMLGGIRTGEVTVLSADTGSGKSTFSMNFFKNLADQGHGIWFNSYEMDPKVTNRKFASLVLKKKMKFKEFEISDIQFYQNYLKEKKIYINPENSKVNLSILRSQIEMASLAYGVKYILLDHFDYIYSTGDKNSTLENIDEAIRGIHQMAMEFKVGIILVVHPKQISEAREINISDLKGSSAIKQYADNILILTRMDRLDENDKLRVKLRVGKNRLCGREGSFFLRYVPEIDGYTESY